MLNLSNFIILIPLTALLFGCGSSEDGPLSLSEYNQKCLENKISGQFLVKYSDGSHEVVSASSNKDFFDKILSKDNQSLLKKKQIKIAAVDFNFKVELQQLTPPEITPPSSAPLADSPRQDGPHMLKAQYLWNKGFWGQNVSTALIDSGYSINHPLLKNSVQINTKESGLDEDQNGFKGDRTGWDFLNKKPLTKDLGSHGTLVGSVIAAIHTPDYEFSMAPGSKILPIAALKPLSEGETSASGEANTIISAIDYAISKNVDFINASWAGNICSQFIRAKVEEATNAGIIFVTSAGNEGIDLDEQPIFPGSFPFSLLATVGAVNSDSSIQVNSNYGRDVDFFAFGNNVVAAAPHSSMGAATGTSVATPFITGGLALLKSAFPMVPPEALFDALERSRNSQKIPDLERAFLDLKSQ